MVETESTPVIVDGVMAFPDQKDPTQYYYVPDNPKIFISRDEKNGFAIPKIQLIKFRTHDIKGGVFFFDIEFDLDEPQIKAIRETILRERKIDGGLRLNPVSFTEGYAKLILNIIGSNEPLELGYSRLSEKNRFSFHANLDVPGAMAIEKALQGAESPITLLCSLNFYLETDQKRFVNPQIFLKDLLSPVLGNGFDSSNYVTLLDLSDPFFKGRDLKLVSLGDFESNEIDSIEVLMDYDGSQKSVVLDKEKREADLHWPAELKDGKMIRSVSISYTVRFKEGKRNGRPLQISSDKIVTETGHYIINPHELYSFLSISSIALDVDWDKYSAVEVKTEYSDNEASIGLDNSHQLSAEKPEAELRFIVTDPGKMSYKYKLIYKSKEGKDVETQWKETDESVLIVRNPSLENKKEQEK